MCGIKLCRAGQAHWRSTPRTVTHINNLKNNTMYVSVVDGEVVMPDDKISGVDVGFHILLAERLASASFG